MPTTYIANEEHFKEVLKRMESVETLSLDWHCRHQRPIYKGGMGGATACVACQIAEARREYPSDSQKNLDLYSEKNLIKYPRVG